MMFPLPTRFCSASLRAAAQLATLSLTPMLRTAGNTVCSKRKHFNRPRSISLFSLSSRGCLVKTRTRLPIVPTAQSCVYPSILFFACFANTVGPFRPSQDFNHAEPCHPLCRVCGNLSSGYYFVCFLFFLCSNDRAMGFPNSSCLFFDLIPFIYLLS